MKKERYSEPLRDRRPTCLAVLPSLHRDKRCCFTLIRRAEVNWQAAGCHPAVWISSSVRIRAPYTPLGEARSRMVAVRRVLHCVLMSLCSALWSSSRLHFADRPPNAANGRALWGGGGVIGGPLGGTAWHLEHSIPSFANFIAPGPLPAAASPASLLPWLPSSHCRRACVSGLGTPSRSAHTLPLPSRHPV